MMTVPALLPATALAAFVVPAHAEKPLKDKPFIPNPIKT